MTTTTPKSSHRKHIYLVLEILLITLAVLLIYRVLETRAPKLIGLLRKGNISDIEDYIRQEGKKGELVLIGLQILETISIVLPALPVYISAGVLFGKLKGFLMCYITNLIMNLVIFLVAKKWKITTKEFTKYGKNEKFEKLMTITSQPGLLVILMCLLPVMPNGMIPYVSAQTGMELKEFLLGLSVGSLPAILVYV